MCCCCIYHQVSVSDEKVISASDFAAQATSNYLASKVAYNSQVTKTRQATEFAKPPTPRSRPTTAQANSDTAAAKAAEEYARLAKEQYLESKRAYKDQMAKVRKASQFGSETTVTATPRMSSEEYAQISKDNYIQTKTAYYEMLNKQ